MILSIGAFVLNIKIAIACCLPIEGWLLLEDIDNPNDRSRITYQLPPNQALSSYPDNLISQRQWDDGSQQSSLDLTAETVLEVRWAGFLLGCPQGWRLQLYMNLLSALSAMTFSSKWSVD